MAYYFVLFLLYIGFILGIDSIELGKSSTIRPKNRLLGPSKGILTTLTSTTTVSSSGIATYRFINPDTDKTCILLKSDAMIEIKYLLNGIEHEDEKFIPDKVMIKGDCSSSSGEQSNINLFWDDYSLSLYFAKTPGGERWYLSKVELSAKVTEEKFPGILKRHNHIELYNNSMIMPTPVGRSYFCQDEISIELKPNPQDHFPETLHGTLLLRASQIQPFMYRSEDFSTSYMCTAQRSFRSETAPIAIGSTLALAALGIVTGYAAFRYYKVKNVQYNTME